MQRIATSLILLAFTAWPCPASVSTNVPLDHWSYGAIEKLADYDLIDSAMLTMRPISRMEMARHLSEVMRNLQRRDDLPPIIESIVERLKREFRGDLVLIGTLDEWYGESFVKPIEDPYLTYLYANRAPDLENRRGDVFRRGSNVRLGFASRIRMSDTFAFYLHPEYAGAFPDSDNRLDLVAGYGKVMLRSFEVQVGRDSLWWGPGRHGSMLMSNNAKPLTMIKISNPLPLRLPWILSKLGPFKAEWFLTELEADRAIPKTRLSGIRLNVKPHPGLELGISRVVMFGGDGAPNVGFVDYVKTFFALNEQAKDNQIAGFDASLRLPLWHRLPVRSLKFYIDAAGEDEAGGLPGKWGQLVGLQFNDILKTGRTDLRIEYADNHVSGFPDVYYNHSLYRSGYTYEGRILGHHMGTDSRDVFVQLTHYLTEDVLLDLAYDRQSHNLSGSTHSAANVFEGGATLFPSHNWCVRTGYRYEKADSGPGDNHIAYFQLTREF